MTEQIIDLWFKIPIGIQGLIGLVIGIIILPKGGKD